MFLIFVILIGSFVNADVETTFKIPKYLTVQGDTLYLTQGVPYRFNATYEGLKGVTFDVSKNRDQIQTHLYEKLENYVLKPDYFFVEPDKDDVGNSFRLQVYGYKVSDGKKVDIADVSVVVVNLCESQGGTCIDTTNYECPINTIDVSCENAQGSISSSFAARVGNSYCCPVDRTRIESNAEKRLNILYGNFQEKMPYFDIILKPKGIFGTLFTKDIFYTGPVYLDSERVDIVIQPKSAYSFLSGKFRYTLNLRNVLDDFSYRIPDNILDEFSYSEFRVNVPNTNRYSFCYMANLKQTCVDLKKKENIISDVPLSATYFYLMDGEQVIEETIEEGFLSNPFISYGVEKCTINLEIKKLEKPVDMLFVNGVNVFSSLSNNKLDYEIDSSLSVDLIIQAEGYKRVEKTFSCLDDSVELEVEMEELTGRRFEFSGAPGGSEIHYVEENNVLFPLDKDKSYEIKYSHPVYTLSNEIKYGDVEFDDVPVTTIDFDEDNLDVRELCYPVRTNNMRLFSEKIRGSNGFSFCPSYSSSDSDSSGILHISPVLNSKVLDFCSDSVGLSITRENECDSGIQTPDDKISDLSVESKGNGYKDYFNVKVILSDNQEINYDYSQSRYNVDFTEATAYLVPIDVKYRSDCLVPVQTKNKNFIADFSSCKNYEIELIHMSQDVKSDLNSFFCPDKRNGCINELEIYVDDKLLDGDKSFFNMGEHNIQVRKGNLNFEYAVQINPNSVYLVESLPEYDVPEIAISIEAQGTGPFIFKFFNRNVKIDFEIEGATLGTTSKICKDMITAKAEAISCVVRKDQTYTVKYKFDGEEYFKQFKAEADGQKITLDASGSDYEEINSKILKGLFEKNMFIEFKDGGCSNDVCFADNGKFEAVLIEQSSFRFEGKRNLKITNDFSDVDNLLNEKLNLNFDIILENVESISKDVVSLKTETQSFSPSGVKGGNTVQMSIKYSDLFRSLNDNSEKSANLDIAISNTEAVSNKFTYALSDLLYGNSFSFDYDAMPDNIDADLVTKMINFLLDKYVIYSVGSYEIEATRAGGGLIFEICNKREELCGKTEPIIFSSTDFEGARLNSPVVYILKQSGKVVLNSDDADEQEGVSFRLTVDANTAFINSSDVNMEVTSNGFGLYGGSSGSCDKIYFDGKVVFVDSNYAIITDNSFLDNLAETLRVELKNSETSYDVGKNYSDLQGHLSRSDYKVLGFGSSPPGDNTITGEVNSDCSVSGENVYINPGELASACPGIPDFEIVFVDNDGGEIDVNHDKYSVLRQLMDLNFNKNDDNSYTVSIIKNPDYFELVEDVVELSEKCNFGKIQVKLDGICLNVNGADTEDYYIVGNKYNSKRLGSNCELIETQGECTLSSELQNILIPTGSCKYKAAFCADELEFEASNNPIDVNDVLTKFDSANCNEEYTLVIQKEFPSGLKQSSCQKCTAESCPVNTDGDGPLLACSAYPAFKPFAEWTQTGFVSASFEESAGCYCCAYGEEVVCDGIPFNEKVVLTINTKELLANSEGNLKIPNAHTSQTFSIPNKLALSKEENAVLTVFSAGSGTADFTMQKDCGVSPDEIKCETVDNNFKITFDNRVYVLKEPNSYGVTGELGSKEVTIIDDEFVFDYNKYFVLNESESTLDESDECQTQINEYGGVSLKNSIPITGTLGEDEKCIYEKPKCTFKDDQDNQYEYLSSAQCNTTLIVLTDITENGKVCCVKSKSLEELNCEKTFKDFKLAGVKELKIHGKDEDGSCVYPDPECNQLKSSDDKSYGLVDSEDSCDNDYPIVREGVVLNNKICCVPRDSCEIEHGRGYFTFGDDEALCVKNTKSGKCCKMQECSGSNGWTTKDCKTAEVLISDLKDKIRKTQEQDEKRKYEKEIEELKKDKYAILGQEKNGLYCCKKDALSSLRSLSFMDAVKISKEHVQEICGPLMESDDSKNTRGFAEKFYYDCWNEIELDEEYNYNGEFIADCITSNSAYCQGVAGAVMDLKKGIFTFKTLGQAISDIDVVDSLLDWKRKIEDSAKYYDAIIGVANLFGADWDSASDLDSKWRDTQLYKSTFGVWNNLIGGLSDTINALKPSTQLEAFCNGQGLYGFPVDELYETDLFKDLRNDQLTNVNLIVSRQNYMSEDSTDLSEKENQTKYVYLFTWSVGGFDENVTYKIWLSNDEDKDISTNEFCFKYYNLTDFGEDGNYKDEKISECFKFKLRAGNSHVPSQNPADGTTLKAVFLNDEYTKVCIKFTDKDDLDPVNTQANDDVQKFSAFTEDFWVNLGSDVVELGNGNLLGEGTSSAFREVRLGDGRDFMCVDINDMGLGVQESGDLSGDPYFVYKHSSAENSDDDSDDESDD